MGPLQFLPSSWRQYGVDGNGDGVVDAQNLYDAALGAASYLCAAGGDLAVGADWARAVTAYNPAESYLDSVRSAAVAYGERAR